MWIWKVKTHTFIVIACEVWDSRSFSRLIVLFCFWCKTWFHLICHLPPMRSFPKDSNSSLLLLMMLIFCFLLWWECIVKWASNEVVKVIGFMCKMMRWCIAWSGKNNIIIWPKDLNLWPPISLSNLLPCEFPDKGIIILILVHCSILYIEERHVGT